MENKQENNLDNEISLEEKTEDFDKKTNSKKTKEKINYKKLFLNGLTEKQQKKYLRLFYLLYTIKSLSIIGIILSFFCFWQILYKSEIAQIFLIVSWCISFAYPVFSIIFTSIKMPKSKKIFWVVNFLDIDLKKIVENKNTESKPKKKTKKKKRKFNGIYLLMFLSILAIFGFGCGFIYSAVVTPWFIKPAAVLASFGYINLSIFFYWKVFIKNQLVYFEDILN